MKAIRLFVLFLLAPVVVCVGAEKIRISTFSSVLTEIAQQVGGDRVEVFGHVKPGIDPHDFEPRPSDLKAVANAQLVLLSAKHMEGYVGKLEDATGTKGGIIRVGDQFPSLKLSVQHGDHSHDGEDPHWWHSIRNIARATKIVRDELAKLSPADKATFNSNASAYLSKLETLDAWVKNKVAELPRDKRKLITNHDAFGYFAREYGFTVMPIAGLSKNDQPGSKKTAELIQAIKATGVKAVFSEDVANPKVIQEIAKATGAKFGGSLLSDGLGLGDAQTVEGMFKRNVNTIVDNLK